MRRLGWTLFLLLILLGCKFSTEVQRDEVIVCLNFDDGFQSVYDNALPLMNQYGFRGTVFVNSGKVGQVNLLNWQHLEQLKTMYHWEIGGHTLYHEVLADLSPAEAEHTISADYQNLSEHGLEPVSFATTYGYCPIEYYPVISDYYSNIRTCYTISMHNPIDRTAVGCFVVTNPMSVQQVVSVISQGIAEKDNLIVLLFHDIETDNTSYLCNYDPVKFAEVMRRLHKLGVKVLPLNEALDYLED
jgi:peptidoglycan/xylan/chitin deacetylase (PgdA/CDA1 family)